MPPRLDVARLVDMRQDDAAEDRALVVRVARHHQDAQREMRLVDGGELGHDGIVAAAPYRARPKALHGEAWPCLNIHGVNSLRTFTGNRMKLGGGLPTA